MRHRPAELSLVGRAGVVKLSSPPVNALGQALRQALAERLEQAEHDPAIGAVVLIGEGSMFSAGADISEFGSARDGLSLTTLIDRFAACEKPVIAAVHGQALGGGLELALGCYYRIAQASARLGLPEVKLGIVPGAGGSQRLPRAIGPRKALDMIALGHAVGAGEALAIGLIDAVAQEGSLLDEALAFAERILKEGGGSRRLDARDDRLAEGRDDPAMFDEFLAANARKFKGFDAPVACVDCVKAACEKPFRDGLAFERQTCERLMAGAQSVALRHAFFAERDARKIPGETAHATIRSIARVGVVGAGTMGGGIAMNFLNAGLPVTIVETTRQALDRGVAIVRRNYEATARKGRISESDVEARMALLTHTLDLGDLADCDLVIEAVFEDMTLKREIFRRLDEVARPDAILASNTSFLDLDEIAAATTRPEDVVGLHFFSPANVMRMLEVVRGEKTAPDVVATAMALAKTIGKVAICVGVCEGFVANRLLIPRQREAQALTLEGATPSGVDRVLEDFGMPVGPFAMDDIVGVDLGWSRETSKGESVRDILCERDRRGQKTGAGYYDYDHKRRRAPSAEVEAVIREVAARESVAQRTITDEEILERCLYPMVNEGAKILEEGKAQRASDIDVAWLAGFGWPAWRGGPMHWGEAVGLATIVRRLEEFERERGAAFRPAALLRRLASQGGAFADLKRA